MSAAAPAFVPPRHIVVLGHPDPDSFGGSVARGYCETVRALGQEAVLRDLYALDFDPRLRAEERPGHGRDGPAAADLAAEIAPLGAADVIVLVYPIWFGMPPAIIKGYVDRVFGAGFDAGAIRDGRPHPLLAGKRLALFTSSATTRPWLEEKGQWSALRHAFDTYLQTIFGLRGAGHTHFEAVVPGMPQGQFDEYRDIVGQRARALAAEALAEKRARQAAAVRDPAARGTGG